MSTINNLLNILNEPVQTSQIKALLEINSLIHTSWPEVLPAAEKLKSFVEGNNFPEKSLVNSILSKMYYHLSKFDLSFHYASNSGEYFNIDEDSSYVSVLIDYAMDKFVNQSFSRFEDPSKTVPANIIDLTEKVINRQIERGDYENVLGIAIDAMSPRLFKDCLKCSLVHIEAVSTDLQSVRNKQKRIIEFSLSIISRIFCEPILRSFASTIYEQSARYSLFSPLKYSHLLMRYGLKYGLTDLLTSLTLNLDPSCFIAKVHAIESSDSQKTNKISNPDKDKADKPENEKISSAKKNTIPKIRVKMPKNNKTVKETNSCEDIIKAPVIDMNDDPVKSSESELLALQIAFDLNETTDQRLISGVLSNFRVPFYQEDEYITLSVAKVPFSEVYTGEDLPFGSLLTEKTSSGTRSATEINALIQELLKTRKKINNPDQGEYSSEELRKFGRFFSPEHLARSTVIRHILMGRHPSYLMLQFQYGSCRRGSDVMGAILQRIGNKNPISSGSLLLAHAMGRCGTGQDGFVRRNTAWFAETSRWTKFSAVASLGVIHKGNIQRSMQLMSSFLPRTSAQGAAEQLPYQEGGALYALGLIHSNNGYDCMKYLMSALKEADGNEIVQHGGCLGLGICSISQRIMELNVQFMSVLQQDNSLAGQAAAIAIGLNGIGLQCNIVKKDLLEIARATKHEKITRGVAISLALLSYGGEEHSNSIFNPLLKDENEILRYGGCFALGLAYIGTENIPALRKLLEVAATDISGDVRRAAIMSLVFLLCRVPHKVLDHVQMFAESFNPQARYGSAMAIGISFAGTVSKEALNVLKPLLKDKVEYVRNMAAMAISLVLLQPSANDQKLVNEHWKDLYKIIKLSASSDFPSFLKSGAIIATGLLCLGDGKCTVSMLTDSGIVKPVAAAGILMFMQGWYWFPYYHFLALAVKPNAFIGVTSELKLPKHYKLFCDGKSKYEPPNLQIEEPKEEVKQSNLKLSISGKAKRMRNRRQKLSSSAFKILSAVQPKLRQNKQQRQDQNPKSDIKSSKKSVPVITVPNNLPQNNQEITLDGRPMNGEEEWVKIITNAVGNDCLLSNPCSITHQQRKNVAEIAGQRYQAVRKGFGIVMLRNTYPSVKEYVETNRLVHDLHTCRK